MPNRQILDLISEYVSTKERSEEYPNLFTPSETEGKLQDIADAFGAAMLRR